MRFRTLFLACALFLSAEPIGAQTLEQRVARLEARVAELWQLLDRARAPGTVVPAELVGNEHLRWGYPGGECEVLVNDYFIACHHDGHRIPEWVAYHLTSEYLAGDAARSDDFRPDPRLPVGARAELRDYANSGYDRGHMAPAAAFKRSEAAMSQTFLLSNIAPQTATLNRNLWRRLEEDVRDLASAAAGIWVVTGSLFLNEQAFPTEPATFIGANAVAVPTHFYKVILAADRAQGVNAVAGTIGADVSGAVELYAFVMANQTERLSGSPSDYLVSVDLVEYFSGLDFFAALPDSLEDALEAATATAWPAR